MGWRLEGAAVFRLAGSAACFGYRVDLDLEWRTREGAVQGWVGPKAPLDLRIARTGAGAWVLNGAVAPNLEGCVDLDLGFTPATNLSQLRRVALEVGHRAAVSVAWLDVPAGKLSLLEQVYERRGEEAYWYEAPRFDYAALLQVSSAGFVRRYPGLWEAVE